MLSWRYLIILILLPAIIITACQKESHPDLWGSGILEAQEVAVATRTVGAVLEVNCQEGDRVDKNQIVARIDTTDLVLQYLELEAQFEEINTMIQGTRLAYARAQEEAQLAQTTAQRTQALFDDGSVTQQALDEVLTRKNVAEWALKEIENKSQELATRKNRIQKSLDRLQENISQATIRAPIAGVVLERLHEPGEVLRYGDRVLILANLDTMWIKIYIKEEDIDRVSPGMTAQIQVDAMENRILPGTVRWVASEAEFTPKNIITKESRAGLVYAVKIDVPNPDGILKIGMPAEATISD